MRIFHCEHCGTPVPFGAQDCASCGSQIGYGSDERAIRVLGATADPVVNTVGGSSQSMWRCLNTA